jgi:16S rRNA (cytidine1402-2'-O)-methyltransferase
MKTPSTSRLLVAATPIGNPGDASPRLVEALTTAGLILAEDTRRAAGLFRRLGITAGKTVSFHDHNEEGRIGQVLDALSRGETVVLVSDAGTPLLSDPGYRLVRACREQGFPVSPLPGPSAPVAALSACGLPPYPFAFLGFMPRKAGAVREALAPFARLGLTLVFFERKDRLAETLGIALAVLGERECAVARELTKDFEEFLVKPLSEWAQFQGELLGEITVVVGPPGHLEADPEEAALAVLGQEREAGGKPREIARRAAGRLKGWTVKALYERLGTLG